MRLFSNQNKKSKIQKGNFVRTCATYFIAKYDTDLLSKEKALGKKRPVILQLLRKCSGNPQNTASLRLKSRLAEKKHCMLYLTMTVPCQVYFIQEFTTGLILHIERHTTKMQASSTPSALKTKLLFYMIISQLCGVAWSNNK